MMNDDDDDDDDGDFVQEDNDDNDGNNSYASFSSEEDCDHSTNVIIDMYGNICLKLTRMTTSPPAVMTMMPSP